MREKTVRVNLTRWRNRALDNPDDPYQFKRCRQCALGNHAECDHHMNDSAVDALDFVNVRCICQCHDDGWELMREGQSHVGVETERHWSKDLPSTKITLRLSIPNMYLTSAVIGRNQDGKVIEDLKAFYDKLGLRYPGGDTTMTIEDLALLIGREWEAAVETRITQMIGENKRLALEEEEARESS